MKLAKERKGAESNEKTMEKMGNKKGEEEKVVKRHGRPRKDPNSSVNTSKNSEKNSVNSTNEKSPKKRGPKLRKDLKEVSLTNESSGKRQRKLNRRFIDFEVKDVPIKLEKEDESSDKEEYDEPEEPEKSEEKEPDYQPEIENEKSESDGEEEEYVIKKRGRPRKEKKKPSSKIKSDPNSHTKNSKTGETVKCAKCKKEMAKSTWNSHNLSTHNNMGWLEGKPNPDYENNLDLWRSMLFVVFKKKKQLNCDKCGLTRKSVFGFISHYQFCGKTAEEKESMMWTCPLCQGVFMPSSQDVHERIHRENDKKNGVILSLDANNQIIVPTDPTTPTSRKRKAAEKANDILMKITGMIKDNDKDVVEINNKVKDEPPPKKMKFKMKDLINKPTLLKKVPSVAKSIWLKAIEANQEAKCRRDGCTFSSCSFEELCSHYNQCKFKPKPTYVCRICKHMVSTAGEMKVHMKTAHADHVVSDDSDLKSSGSNESFDDSSDDEKDDKIKIIKKSNKRQFRYTNHYQIYAKFMNKDVKLFNYHYKMTYNPAYHWTVEFEQKHYQPSLFEHLQPNEFELITEAEEYLPKLKQSMQFGKEKYSSKVKSDKVIKNHKWKHLNLFESFVDSDVPIFFVGGPVWALAFLPIPESLFTLKPDQFIALSTNPTMESNYNVGDSHKFKNSFQIWNLGPLSNEASAKPRAPKLGYVVAHETGTIWAMEWCPSGAYKVSKKKLGVKRRMGLLATGCSDGGIYIYSLPFPEDINRTAQIPVYKTDPIITLCVNKLLLDKGEVNYQCMTLNWSKVKGHDILAAGFSNGFIAVWNLNTKSPLLTFKCGNTTFINCFKHFYAHKHAVSFVGMLPYSDQRFMVSSSVDRCSKVWDLEDTSYEIESIKRGVSVNGGVLNNWLGMVISYDDVLGLQHTVTYFYGFREIYQKNITLMPTNSTAYGLAVSDYLNGVCHGNLAGDLFTVFPLQLFYLRDIDKFNKRRLLLSSTKVVDFQENSNQNVLHKAKSNDKEYVYKPKTYNECKDRYGILFCDDLNNTRYVSSKNCDKKNPFTADVIKSIPVELYPFTSINRVSWNSNQWSYLWLASGYQSGFVRLVPLQTFSSQIFQK